MILGLENRRQLPDPPIIFTGASQRAQHSHQDETIPLPNVFYPSWKKIEP